MEAPDEISLLTEITNKKYSLLETIQIFEVIVTAVCFIHQNGLIHGDVHPSRIQKFSKNHIKFNSIGLPS
jgi:serine/threonine protein kinase